MFCWWVTGQSPDSTITVSRPWPVTPLTQHLGTRLALSPSQTILDQHAVSCIHVLLLEMTWRLLASVLFVAEWRAASTSSCRCCAWKICQKGCSAVAEVCMCTVHMRCFCAVVYYPSFLIFVTCLQEKQQVTCSNISKFFIAVGWCNKLMFSVYWRNCRI